LNPKPKPEIPQPLHEWSFEAIGTQWWVGLFESVSPETLGLVKHVISERIEVFDKTYSRFRADSLITEISKHSGTFTFPPNSKQLFEFCRELYDVSGGVVTPLIGQLMSDAGYDASYSLRSGKLHEPPSWDDVMEFDGQSLKTKQPVLLDFGAAGKGYLVDLVAIELQKAGVEKFCVDASGDMYCHGIDSPLRIGLENPDDTSQVIGVAEFKDGALCGSAGNRRAWGEFTHIIDPKKLESPRHIKAVWVSTNNALTADGLTTALYFAELEQLHTKFQFEHCIMYADGSVSVSQHFPAELFTA